MCGETSVTKLPSAPRLNLGTPVAGVPAEGMKVSSGEAGPPEQVAALPPASLQAAWMQMVRRVMANTEDVGERFAEEARRIHYGEADERGIRGQATQGRNCCAAGRRHCRRPSACAAWVQGYAPVG